MKKFIVAVFAVLFCCSLALAQESYEGEDYDYGEGDDEYYIDPDTQGDTEEGWADEEALNETYENESGEDEYEPLEEALEDYEF
ncbi:hypothetical protein ACFL1K_03570 [Candidatus Omnitrophota bacterium]